MPESLAGYGDCGVARVDIDTGGFGAGRLGIKFGCSFEGCIVGLFPGKGALVEERGGFQRCLHHSRLEISDLPVGFS